jgi:hypothetical protein
MIDDGDSQETSPAGQGSEYNPLVAWELWRRYRNIPESQVYAVGSTGGTPPACLGMKTARYLPVAPGDMPVSAYPYYMQPAVDNKFNNVATTGPAFTLQHNLIGVNANLTEINRNIEYIKRENVKFRMLFPMRLTQGTLAHYRCSLVSDGSNNFFVPDQLANTFVTDDLQVDAFAFGEYGITYSFGGTTPTPANINTVYAQVIVRSGDANPIEVGPCYFQSNDRRGISYSMWSEGGRRTQDLFTDRPNCGGFIQAWSPDIIRLKTGANDGAQGFTAAQYKTNMLAKIATYQSLLPTAVFILESDADRTGLTAPQRTEFDNYADVLAEIAADPANRAVFINVRRLLHERHQWFAGSGTITSYIPDGVHYSTAGARLVANSSIIGLFDATKLRPVKSSVRPLRQFGGLRRGSNSCSTSFRIGS